MAKDNGTVLCECGHGHKMDLKTKTRTTCASGNCRCTSMKEVGTIIKAGNQYELTDTMGDIWVATYDAATKTWGLNDPWGVNHPLAGASSQHLQPILVRNIMEIRDEFEEEKQLQEKLVAPLPALAPPVIEEPPVAEEPPAKSTKEKVRQAAKPKAEEKEITPEAREKARERIAKLIALGNDKSASPMEAEAVLARAAEMMLRYGLSDEDFRRTEGDGNAAEEEVVQWHIEVDLKGGHGQFRKTCMIRMIRAMGGKAYFTWNKGQSYLKQNIWVHAAAPESVMAAIQAWLPYAMETMEKQANSVSRQKSHEARLRGEHHSLIGGRARQMFMLGFADGVAERIEASRVKIKEEASESQALVLRDQTTILTSWIKDNWPKLEATNLKLHDDSEAYSRGHVAGHTFASPGVAGASKGALE